MSIYEIAYYYEKDDIRYAHCEANSIEEVKNMMANTPVDMFVPNGKTYNQNYISIKKVNN